MYFWNIIFIARAIEIKNYFSCRLWRTIFVFHFRIGEHLILLYMVQFKWILLIQVKLMVIVLLKYELFFSKKL